MSILYESVTSFFAVIFVFGLVIFLHEGGHFLVCKWLKVRVEKFAFGMGPEVFGFDYGQTRYAVHLFPLGGFVKPAGESLESVEGKPDEYFAQPWYMRLLIVYAGPAMNYVLAFFVLLGLFWVVGLPIGELKPVVGELVPEFPAFEAGLRPGDKVLEIEGKPIDSWEALASTIHGRPEKETTLLVERRGERFELSLTPKLDPAHGVGLVGIRPKLPEKLDYERQPFLKAVRLSVEYCWEFSIKSLTTIFAALAAGSGPDVAGPVGIIKTVHEVKKSGFIDLLHLMALLSIAVGFFNLLPIPLLDGGHAVLFIWEGISRKPLSEKLVRNTSVAGLAILVSILIFATSKDITRMSKERRMKKAIEQSAPIPAPAK